MTAEAPSLNTAKLDAILAGRVEEGEPGFSVGLAVKGQPVFTRSYGLADVNGGAPLRHDTVMSIGSISKHFAAFAFLLLCDDGLATPEDTIGQYLPHLHAANRDARMIDLMAHVSGLWDGCEASILANGPEAPRTIRDLLAFYDRGGGRNFGAREGWDYNNGGYELVTAVIEAIAGISLAEFLDRRVFRPLGMVHSRLRPDSGRFLVGAAASHVRDGASGWRAPKWGVEVGGAGGVVSTVDDMLRWLAHMREPRIGSPHIWALMCAPQHLKNGFSTGYGMGLTIYEHHGVRIIGHTGGGSGSNAQMITMPDAGVDLVILSNRGDVWSVDLSYRIIESLFDWPAEERQPGPAAASGTFYNSDRNSLLELIQWEGIPALAVDDMVLPIAKDASGAWNPTPGFDFFRFRLPPEAISEGSVLLEDYGEPVRFTRCAPAASCSISEFPGRYRSLAADAEIMILPDDEVRFEGRFGQATYRAAHVEDHVWTLRGEDNPAFVRATLRVEVETLELVVTTSRNRRMTYQRCGEGHER